MQNIKNNDKAIYPPDDFVSYIQKIVKEEDHRDISDKEALNSATSLINMIRHVYKPITKKDYEKNISNR